MAEKNVASTIIMARLRKELQKYTEKVETTWRMVADIKLFFLPIFSLRNLERKRANTPLPRLMLSEISCLLSKNESRPISHNVS